MNELAEISEAWQYYRKCKRYSDQYPGNVVFDHLTMKSYAKVLMLEAQYWSGVRP